jgi:hypothetical protein
MTKKKSDVKLIPLRRVPNGSRCIHSGRVAAARGKTQLSLFDDAGIEFRKTEDAFQTTTEGEEVIFGMNDLVTVINWGKH